MGVVLMKHFDFKDLMAFGMFILALLTFFGRVRGGISIIHLPIEVNPLWAVVFPLLYFQYSTSVFKLQDVLFA